MNKLAALILEDNLDFDKKIDFSVLDKKTIIITGATGLVGTYLTASLKKIEENIGISVNLTCAAKSTPPEYFNDLLPKKTEITLGDITDHAYLEKLPEADFIIHAAGYGQPGKFMENQVKTLELNTSSLFTLFKKLKSTGSLLFMSSSEVYSNLENPPYTEDQIGITNTTHKRSCYIEGKRSGEAICNAYRAQGVHALSARLSLAYGPGTRQSDKRVLNNFISKALNGTIDLLDQGHAKRTYCYITDAVEILWHMIISGKDPVYNVAGESKTTIAELAEKVGSTLEADVVFPENKEGGLEGAPLDVCLNIDKAKKEFNKSNFVSLDDGLKRTIEWQKVLYNK